MIWLKVTKRELKTTNQEALRARQANELMLSSIVPSSHKIPIGVREVGGREKRKKEEKGKGCKRI